MPSLPDRLPDAYEGLAARNSMPAFRTRAIERLIALYEAWNGAEPNHGHLTHAERWRAALNTTACDAP